jgi:glycine oxidase
MSDTFDVIIVGAGVMGCGTAYWLTRAGCKVLVLEQQSLAHGASGVAAAMLEAVGHGAKLDSQSGLAKFARHSFLQHGELWRVLQEESGVDIGYRENPVIYPVFSEGEIADMKPTALDLRREYPDIRWVEGPELFEIEPRLNPEALGGVVTKQAQLLAYPYVLALATAAEKRGMLMRHGEVVGLQRQAARVTGVRLRNGETISGDAVVLAMGPWSQQAERWTGLRIPVYPVRGQLLQLRFADPQLEATVSYQGMYLVHKANGITLAGATEEHDSGFNTQPSERGRDTILDAILQLVPSAAQAQIVGQIAGLRPCSRDGRPLIGAVAGSDGLYINTGHFRSGMLLSAASTRILAELIVEGASSFPIDIFDPSRFGRAGD